MMDADKIYVNTSKEIIYEGYEQAKLALLRQNERFDRLIRNASTLFGILVTVMTVLIGAFYTQVRNNPSNKIISIIIAAAFIVTIISAGILLLGVMSGRSFISDGANPKSFFSDEVVKWCADMGRKGFSDDEKSDAFFAYRATVIEYDMMKNEGLLCPMIKRYRLSVKILFWGYVALGLIYVLAALCFA